MLYGLIAEDRKILSAGQVLIARISQETTARIEPRVLNGKPAFVADAWRVVKEFCHRFPDMHKILAVCDADHDDAEELEAALIGKILRRCGPIPMPLLCHVIKIELETWWMADVDTISRVVGGVIPYPGGNAETIRDPKEILIRRLRDAGCGPYTDAKARAFAEHLDFGVAEARAPGFGVFRQKVENGVTRGQAIVQ